MDSLFDEKSKVMEWIIERAPSDQYVKIVVMTYSPWWIFYSSLNNVTVRYNARANIRQDVMVNAG